MKDTSKFLEESILQAVNKHFFGPIQHKNARMKQVF